MSNAFQLNELDDAFHGFAMCDLLAANRRREEHALERIGGQPRMPPGHDVVEDAHVREQLDVLEGARNPEPGHRARRKARNVMPAKADAAFALVDAADAVESAGLAGAVGT